jgi:hypothetical protein
MGKGEAASRKRALCWCTSAVMTATHRSKDDAVRKRSMIMKPILSAFLALALVAALAATAGAEDWNVKTFWQQVDSNHNWALTDQDQLHRSLMKARSALRAFLFSGAWRL